MAPLEVMEDKLGATGLLVSVTTAARRSYARAKDMAFSMSFRFWSSTSVFKGSTRLAV